MFVRWQSRKRNQPDVGYWEGHVRDATGDPENPRYVRDNRGNCLLTRRRADGTLAQDARWTAILVESVRINGKPRQRYVAWLASITESRMEIVHQRRYFWDAVYERLDHLGNRISIEDRRKIEAAIALKVPRLSREEHEASVSHVTSEYGLELASVKPYTPPA